MQSEILGGEIMTAEPKTSEDCVEFMFVFLWVLSLSEQWIILTIQQWKQLNTYSGWTECVPWNLGSKTNQDYRYLKYIYLKKLFN